MVELAGTLPLRLVLRVRLGSPCRLDRHCGQGRLEPEETLAPIELSRGSPGLVRMLRWPETIADSEPLCLSLRERMKVDVGVGPNWLETKG